MTHINLLPWREELRTIRNRFFYALLGGTIVGCILILIVGNIFLQAMTSKEEKNIQALQAEQKKISEKIKEIQTLQQDKKDLLQRMEVIQTIRAARGATVRLLDILPRVTPEGIYLTEVERKENQIIISGNAQTNTIVSVFLENFEDPKWGGIFKDIQLEEISTNKDGGLNFKIKFKIEQSR